MRNCSTRERPTTIWQWRVDVIGQGFIDHILTRFVDLCAHMVRPQVQPLKHPTSLFNDRVSLTITRLAREVTYL